MLYMLYKFVELFGQAVEAEVHELGHEFDISTDINDPIRAEWDEDEVRAEIVGRSTFTFRVKQAHYGLYAMNVS